MAFVIMVPVLKRGRYRKHEPCAATQYAIHDAITAPMPPKRGISAKFRVTFVKQPIKTVSKCSFVQFIDIRKELRATPRLTNNPAHVRTASIAAALSYAWPNNNPTIHPAARV